MGRVRHRWILGILSLFFVTIGLQAPVAAQDALLPGPCKLHPVHIVNPSCVPALTADLRDSGVTLPDLVPDVGQTIVLRSSTFDEATQTWAQGPEHLWFDTYTQNLGTVPFEISVNDPLDAGSSIVSQCVSWTTNYICRQRSAMSGVFWDNEQIRFRSQGYASYAIRRLDPTGRPDYSEAGVVASTNKTFFCPHDSVQVDSQAFPIPTYKICTSARMGTSPGWADEYDFAIPGQMLSLEGLAGGHYALVVSLDLNNGIYESNETNNLVEVTFELSNDRQSVQILGRYWP